MIWNNTSPSLSQINGVCVDRSDNVLVADTDNNKVVQFSATNNTAMAIYTTISPELAEPDDVAVDDRLSCTLRTRLTAVIAIQGRSMQPSNAGNAGIVRCPAKSNRRGSLIVTGQTTLLYLALAIVWVMSAVRG